MKHLARLVRTALALAAGAGPWVFSPGAAAADHVEVELVPAARPMEGAKLERLARLRAEAERIRGLKLKGHPPWSQRDRGELYQLYTRTINSRVRRREVRLATGLGAAFGFWGPDFDLLTTQLRARAGAVGASYSPHERAFTMVSRPAAYAVDTSQINQDSQVVHEYVHAIQDQHFGFSRLGLYGGNDSSKAARALIEGDAVLAMSIYAVGRTRGRAQEARLAYVSRQVLWRAAGINAVLETPAMKKVPRMLGVSMVFPYVHGSPFVLRAYKRGGWAEVDRCYRVPPASSEQVMHPEKYFRPVPEDPVRVRLPAVPSAVLPGAVLVDRDTVGEIDARSLLEGFVSRPEARIAAAGWGGDQFVAYERTGGPAAGELVICWLSVWDRPQDAREFFRAYAKALDGKCGLPRRKLDRGGWLLDWRGEGAKRPARLERWGAAVLSVEGAEAAETARLADLMWQAERELPPPRYRVRLERIDELLSAAGLSGAEAVSRLIETAAGKVRALGQRKVPSGLDWPLFPGLDWRVASADAKTLKLAARRGEMLLEAHLRWKALSVRDKYRLCKLYLENPTAAEHLALAYLCRLARMTDEARGHLWKHETAR